MLKTRFRRAESPRVATIVRDATLDRLRHLIETQRLVNAGPADAERVMNLVVQRAQAACHADGAAVELAEGDTMVVQAVTGLAERGTGIGFALENSLSGQCARFGMPLIAKDAETDGRVDGAACRALGIRSLAVAPLVQAGQGVGVLKVTSSQLGAFDDTDGDVLELMANLVVSSLSVATLPLYLDTQNPLQDPVTGLANGALLMDRLGQLVYESRRYGRPFGIFVIDLDHFSAINETLGREAGDAVLEAVARWLKSTVRSGDTLARMEADQFVVLCNNAERSIVEPRLTSRIEQVLASADKELALDGMAVEASIGTAWSSGNDASAESLLTAATTALSRIKRQRDSSAGT